MDELNAFGGNNWQLTYKVGLPKEDGWYIWLDSPGCGCCVDDTGIFTVLNGHIYYFKEPPTLNKCYNDNPFLLELEGKPYPQQWIKVPKPDLS